MAPVAIQLLDPQPLAAAVAAAAWTAGKVGMVLRAIVRPRQEVEAHQHGAMVQRQAADQVPPLSATQRQDLLESYALITQAQAEEQRQAQHQSPLLGTA